jgi:hypothetical protein
MRAHFKNKLIPPILVMICCGVGAGSSLLAQPSAPTAAQNPPASRQSTNSAAPTTSAAPPPAAAPQKSAADLEKLVAPIALYPDPLLASVLPASAYPLEIVQAARFVKDTNNIAKLDAQPWDDNVKAVARFPDVIAQMDQNIGWTSDLGDAFINQPKDLMDAVQTMRSKAQSSGALKTTPQQIVTVTNTIVTNTVEQQVAYVTNQVVQVQPAQSEVIYVPQYNPTVVYAGYPVSYPGYYYPPYYPGTVAAASIVSFGAGMAMGAWMANGCDWGHGGVWGGGNYHSDVNIHNDVNINNNRVNNNRVNNRQNNGNRGNNSQKWQPDQNRLKNSGSSLSSAQSREARGWGSGNGQAETRASTGAAQNRAFGANANLGNRSSAGTGTRPSTANAGTRPSGGAGAGNAGANRSGNLSPTSSRPSANTTQTRQTPSRSTSSGGGGAFNSENASAARSSSARGASSRSFSGGSGGGGFRGGGGGGRGGGRR